MLINQFQSRRQWNLLPEGSATVLWWKITQDKKPDALKTAKVFVEIFVDEPKYKREEQEKHFTASLKGYGAVVKRKEYTIQELSKKI